jgi:hypothetical protein
MGTAYYIVLEKEIEGLNTMMDGKGVGCNIVVLDNAASELGVRPLSMFLSMDKAVIVDILGDDAEGMEIPPLQQFAARDGLATVRALLPRPEAQPAIHDLRECERILTAAAERGVGWHFQIDV